MTEPLSYYLNKIKHLRVDRTHGVPAPHKPLLLLTVFDLIERGEITQNRIEISPLLVETYLNYWKNIPTGQPRLYILSLACALPVSGIYTRVPVRRLR